MNYDRPPVDLPATPDYVLAVIRDSYRQQCRFDPEAEPGVELTFETTIDEWRNTCDLLPWRDLGRALDYEWKLGLPDSAWRAALKPAKTRTLGDLCELIARKAMRPTIEPLRIMGSTCLPAGAFLAIRSLLRDAGVDVDSIAPSTPLDEYARRHLQVFLGPISRLAPNALPDVKVRTLWHDLSCVGVVVCWLLAWALFMAAPLAGVVGLILTLIAFAAMRVFDFLPVEVAFGNLRTFRDLATVVADGARQAKSFG